MYITYIISFNVHQFSERNYYCNFAKYKISILISPSSIKKLILAFYPLNQKYGTLGPERLLIRMGGLSHTPHQQAAPFPFL